MMTLLQAFQAVFEMVRAGIVGASGYTGVELMRLLSQHPGVELAVVASRTEQGRPVSAVFPSLRGVVDLAFSAPDAPVLTDCDLVFFATPTGTAMRQAPALLDAGVKVIDLSADFRLQDKDEWEHWHGLKHACPDRLSQAVYGLPEMNRAQLREAQLVANPGCYPTAAQLGFLPLLEQDLVEPDTLIADAKSGVSGAGSTPLWRRIFARLASPFPPIPPRVTATCRRSNRGCPPRRPGRSSWFSSPICCPSSGGCRPLCTPG